VRNQMRMSTKVDAVTKVDARGGDVALCQITLNTHSHTHTHTPV